MKKMPTSPRRGKPLSRLGNRAKAALLHTLNLTIGESSGLARLLRRTSLRQKVRSCRRDITTLTMEASSRRGLKAIKPRVARIIGEVYMVYDQCSELERRALKAVGVMSTASRQVEHVLN